MSEFFVTRPKKMLAKIGNMSYNLPVIFLRKEHTEMNQTNIKALVCDNTAAIGTTIASSLRERGLTAYTRSNTERAIINSILSEAPDVVISYLTLSDSDVVALINELSRKTTHLPAFIVLSELHNPFIENQVMRCGASYFMVEPIDFDELAEAVYAVSKRSVAKNSADPEIIVTEMIKKICIPPNLKGYRYIRTSVLECLRDRSLIDNITKGLYPFIAEKYDTTPARIERAIRKAIETAWERADKTSIYLVLGYDDTYFTNRPTNSEFIAMLVDQIRLQTSRSAHTRQITATVCPTSEARAIM